MSVEENIVEKLSASFDLKHLDVVNESSGHNVPAGSESHFKVILVSEDFGNLRSVARHRAVHESLAKELAGDVHALAVHTYTESEWRSRFGEAPMSPQCMGGGGSDEPDDAR